MSSSSAVEFLYFFKIGVCFSLQALALAETILSLIVLIVLLIAPINARNWKKCEYYSMKI